MDSFEDSAGLDLIPARAAEAAAALEALKAPGEAAARAIEAAFGKAGESLAKSLSRAAADGKVSLDELAAALIAAVNAASGGGGLGAAVTTALSFFTGARAEGGPVTAGGAYLVGERGPEVFRPAQSGDIGPAGSGGVTVNLNLTGSPTPNLLRSEAQIAQALARAVSLGLR